MTQAFDWDSLHQSWFPLQRYNLNPGTLGTPSLRIRQHATERLEEWAGYPLGLYQQGREALQGCKALVRQCWNAPEHEVAVGWPSTTIANLWTQAVAAFAEDCDVLPVLSTHHEHYGGLSSFEHHPHYTVYKLSLEEEASLDAFRRRVCELQPRVALLSHVTWSNGRVFPVESWAGILREECPDCLVVIDAAQSLGLCDLPFEAADVLFGSTHKWLCGPHGTGIQWIRRSKLEQLPGLCWMDGGLDAQSPSARFESAGGQDFSLYWQMEELMQLVHSIGLTNVQERSKSLGAMFVQWWSEEAAAYDRIRCIQAESGMVILHFEDCDPYPLYRDLNERRVHVKCIKKELSNGEVLNLLRLGFPFYETETRIREAFEILLDTVSLCGYSASSGA